MTRDGVLLVRQRRSLDEDGHTRLGRHGEDPWPTCHQVSFSPRAVDLFIGSKGNEACDGAPLERWQWQLFPSLSDGGGRR